MAVDGSSQDGRCSSISRYNDSHSRCDAPTSSVLFDGDIPTLTGLDGDMWASQLLALQVNNRFVIISDFSGTSNYMGVDRVELVMFNCPEWGIAVYEDIGIGRASSISGPRSQTGKGRLTITSCDSLVRVCTSGLAITEPVIYLQFFPVTGSNRTYIAEVAFYGDGSDCPADHIIIAPPPQDTTTPPPPDTTPPNNNISEASQEENPTPKTTTSYVTIAIAASIGCVVLLIVCLLAAVLILWRCYYVKHHKHNTSHHPAVGEGHINTHSHPPPVTLCEETGQVYYSTPQEIVPQESNDTYSHIHHDTITGRGANKKSREDTVAEDMEMGGYSIVSYGDKPGTYSGPAICEKQGKKESKILSADATVDQLYAQVNKKKKDGDTTHPHPPEANTSVDQLYAQVDKKKKDGDTTHPHPPEANTSVDQLYAQVDKKKKDGDTTHPHPPEADTSVDQLYAQVDKKKKDGDTTHPHPHEADTSVDQLYAQVNKKKKDGDTTHPHPPEADTSVDQLYAQVDKKKKKRDITHHPPVTDASGDQLYAQVDKKKSKGEVCEDSPQEFGAVYSVVNKPHPPQVLAKSDLLMDDLYN